ncbi:MAG: hypothetical protein A4E20_10920 [Nitrospira sp. SG-bin2]|nr:MAG: hypothetical protein A4E20_10920 [Nitrospira sp. SG-bin2]
MAVAFDSASYKFDSLSATDNTTFSHVVSTLATDRAAVLGVVWWGASDATGGTVTASFGGVSMDAGTVVRWFSDKCALYPFTLEDPGTGSKTIQVDVSSMGGAGDVGIVCGTYSGVGSIGSPTTQGPSATVSNSVTVSSDDPCDRVVTVHGINTAPVSSLHFTNYNKTIRMFPGAILLGDGAGAASVVGTATMSSSNSFWGAFGVSLEAAPISIEASLSIPVNISASASLYRVETPDPRRTWVIA